MVDLLVPETADEEPCPFSAQVFFFFFFCLFSTRMRPKPVRK